MSPTSYHSNLSKIKAVIFDLDGTLVHSAVDFLKLKRETIRVIGELGIPTTGLKATMKTYEIMDQARERMDNATDLLYHELEIQVAKIWNYVELKTVEKSVIVSGADHVLRKLKKRGIMVGIVTRGCHAYATRALEITGLLSFVDVVIGRDDTEKSKPNPEPLFRAMSLLGTQQSETLMVGDSIEDETCARSAGVLFIQVKRGKSNASNLKDIEMRVVADIREVIELLGE